MNLQDSKESIYKQLGIKRQGYHQWLCRDKGIATTLIEKIIIEVLKLRSKQPKVGVKKLHKSISKILKEGMIGRDAFIRLLKERGLMVNRALKKKGFNYMTTTNETYAHYAMNDIDIKEAGQVIASDITYLPKGASKHFYLHLCVDLHSRTIVGWKLSHSLETKYCIKALEAGIRTLKEHNLFQQAWIHHSDRGCQYNSKQYCKIIKKFRGYRSMTIGGAPYQNAIVERINGILKQEFLPRVITKDFKAAKKIVKQSIETYNNERLHWSLNLETPMSKLTSKAVNAF